MNPGSIGSHSQFQRPVVKQPLRPVWGMGLEGWQERKRLGQGSRCQVLETRSRGSEEGQMPDKRRWGAVRFPHRSLCRSTKARVRRRVCTGQHTLPEPGRPAPARRPGARPGTSGPPAKSQGPSLPLTIFPSLLLASFLLQS